MNGTISGKVKTGGGTDPVSGDPIPVTYSWTDPVECKYRANELNNRGRYDGGSFQQASYTITTEDMDFDADVIQLLNSRDSLVCEKEVISIEVLEDIQRVKIMI